MIVSFSGFSPFSMPTPLDVYEGTYKGKQVAIKTLKDVQHDAMQSFLAEADVMT